MLHTNLLPEEEKKAIILEQWFRVIKFLSIPVIGTLLIDIALLAPSYLPLYFQNRELQHSLSIQQETTKRINTNQISATVSSIKTTITSLRQASDNPNNALSMFDLLVTQQSGITISGFTIDQKATVTITGRAATRNDLLAFEQHLRDSSRFQDLASPLANIIQETNITFNFQGTLKSAYAL